MVMKRGTMVMKYGSFEVKPLEQLSIIQTKRDKQLVKCHTDLNNSLTCAVCGKEAINFEVIIKTRAIITADGEIEEIKDGKVMLIKPIKCSYCNGVTFIETFTTNNEDLYGQQIH